MRIGYQIIHITSRRFAPPGLSVSKQRRICSTVSRTRGDISSRVRRRRGGRAGAAIIYLLRATCVHAYNSARTHSPNTTSSKRDCTKKYESRAINASAYSQGRPCIHFVRSSPSSRNTFAIISRNPDEPLSRRAKRVKKKGIREKKTAPSVEVKKTWY